jgi:hypothetical protein
MGKLDATMVANGPEDVPSGWDAVDWRAAEENVRGLRRRIFTASQAGEAQQLQPATSPRGLPEPRRGETRMSGS